MNDGTAGVTAEPADHGRIDDGIRAGVITRLGIEDGIVVDRVDTGGDRRRVLYHRSADRLSLDAVNDSLSDLPCHPLDAVVRVTAIPYDADGEVDTEALLALPVLDPALLAVAEGTVRERFGSEEVVAVVVDAAPPPHRIHEYQLQEVDR